MIYYLIKFWRYVLMNVAEEESRFFRPSTLKYWIIKNKEIILFINKYNKRNRKNLMESNMRQCTIVCIFCLWFNLKRKRTVKEFLFVGLKCVLTSCQIHRKLSCKNLLNPLRMGSFSLYSTTTHNIRILYYAFVTLINHEQL